MKKVNIYEAKARLSQLVEEAASGRDVDRPLPDDVVRGFEGDWTTIDSRRRGLSDSPA